VRHALTRRRAPAVWVGHQTWAGHAPIIELYNLTEDITGHPRGSTVSRETLEAAGFNVPPPAASARSRRRRGLRSTRSRP
jgi:hypothetical protein